MSSPHQYSKHASQLQYSFLASRATDVIERAIGKEKLEDQDFEVLVGVEDFLRKISKGAEIVRTGQSNGSSFSDNLDALNIALAVDPVETLSAVLKEDEDLASFVDSLADAVAKLRQTPGSAVSNELEKASLDAVSALFDSIHESIRASLNVTKRQSVPIGTPKYAI